MLSRYSVTCCTAGLLVSLLVCPSPAEAQRGELLVSADWVAQHLDDPNLVLLHVGPAPAYDTTHIRGARLVSLRDISDPDSHQEGNVILELPTPGLLQETLRSLSVSQDSRIVVYWGEEWVTPTARLIFTLDWAGLGGQTSLMDGGLGAWTRGGHPVTNEVPHANVGNVVVRPRELVVEANWVQEHATSNGYQLVDGRSRAFYDGVRADREKEGHIPGAGSVPWTELIDESLLLKSPTALREVFSAAGVEPGDTVVAYCHIGQYATMVLFAARTLGHEVRLYDGAFQDWATRNLPVTTESSSH